MNKIFKVVFNQITNTWVAVSEMAKSNSKKSNKINELPPTVENNSQIAVADSLKGGLLGLAPLCVALMGVFFVPELYAEQVDMPCKYDNTTNWITCGIDNTAKGYRDVAIGYYNTAGNDESYWSYAVAIGYKNRATNPYAVALGSDNSAQETGSSAVGYGNVATGVDSSAMGYKNQALNRAVQVFGYENNLALWENYYEDDYISQYEILDGTVSMGGGAVVLGYQNNYKFTTTQSEAVVNVGEYSTAVGVKNSTSGRNSSAVGYSNIASNENASAMGYKNIATGQYSTAMGYANKAQGTNSFVLGRGNVATGIDSSAVGLFNTASGDKSSAFGFNNQATGTNSLVMGRGNQVSSLNSTAMGVNNIVSGNYSSAFGFDNKAQGANSFALGRSSTAVANFSTALGYGAFANRVAGDVGYSPNNVSHNADKTGVWKSTSGVLSVGDPNNENNKGIITRQITGVAAGKNDTDAVNVAQLKVLKQDIDNLSNQLLSTKSATLLALNEVSNDETSLEVKPIEMLMSSALNTTHEQQLKGEVPQNETIPNTKMAILRSATLSTAPEPAATLSITIAGEKGDFPVSSGGVAKFLGDGQNITTDATGGEVKISLADNIAVNSVNAGGTVVNLNGVTLPSGVALTNSGLNNGGQVISNVASGVKPTDAVNVSQLNNAMGGVYGRIDSVEKHANAGTAQSLAAANMPTAAQPGEGMLAISGGVYRGEQGYAIGYSQLSENGRWVIRATGSGNSRNHFGGAVGVGFKLF